jgi:hypothetical protein
MRSESAFAADFSHVLAILTHGFTAFTANFSHVLAILAHGLATFAGNFALATFIHRSKASARRVVDVVHLILIMWHICSPLAFESNLLDYPNR